MNLRFFYVLNFLAFIFICFSDTKATDHPDIFLVRLVNCDEDPSKNFLQTGFRAKWNGIDGLITALHGVAGCKQYSASQGGEKPVFLDDLILTAVDIRRDIAFLSSTTLSQIGESTLPGATYSIQQDQIRVIGYPDGSWVQLVNPLAYYQDPLKILGSWHKAVRTLCEKRKSPACDVNILLVREDPLVPGHSGAPILNQNDEIVGVANGGLQGGYSLYNWIIPYTEIHLEPVEMYRDKLEDLKNEPFTNLYALPTTLDPGKYTGGVGATIRGNIMYGGYGSAPVGLLSQYSKAKIIIQLREAETRKEIPIRFDYNPGNGSYIIHNVPSGKFMVSVRGEAGYPFYKMSAGDFISYLSGLNKDFVIAPHEKLIERDLNVVKSIHLKLPLDNQKERSFTGDPPEILYGPGFSPSADIFEWEPVPEATRYDCRILTMDINTRQKLDEINISTGMTRITPNLPPSAPGQFYMFNVTAYQGEGWDKMLGQFSNYYKNGFGGWFEFILKSGP